jgi:hypothetical protein
MEKMEQMIKHLIAAIGGPEAVIHNNQTKTDSLNEIIAKMKAWSKEMMACKETMEACLESKEPASLEVESVAVHEEAPKEEAQ